MFRNLNDIQSSQSFNSGFWTRLSGMVFSQNGKTLPQRAQRGGAATKEFKRKEAKKKQNHMGQNHLRQKDRDRGAHIFHFSAQTFFCLCWIRPGVRGRGELLLKNLAASTLTNWPGEPKGC
jgi:hypothetical protein